MPHDPSTQVVWHSPSVQAPSSCLRSPFHTSSWYLWMDSSSTGWCQWFKTFVGNCISCIMEQLPLECWKHVRGIENPADCSSRWIFPSELVQHELWWYGPSWLYLPQTEWSRQSVSLPSESEEERKELCTPTVVWYKNPIIPYDRFSSFTHLKQVTVLVFRFMINWKKKEGRLFSLLTEEEQWRIQRGV